MKNFDSVLLTNSDLIIKKFVYLFYAILILLFIWLFSAKLDSGAVAQGIVIPSGDKVSISHSETAVIKKIVKNEGELIKANEAVLLLDDTEYIANLNIYEQQKEALELQVKRFEAQKNGKLNIKKASNNSTFKNELDIFTSKNKILENERIISEQRIKQIDNAILSTGLQLEKTKEQLVGVRALYEEQYADKNKLFELETKVIELETKLLSLKNQKIEFLNEYLKSKQTFLFETNIDLKKSYDELKSLDEKITLMRAKISKKTVVSPVDGIVNRITYKTLGSSVPANTPLLEVIPANAKLLVEIKLESNDINFVKVGTVSHVRLTAYKSRYYNPVIGKVVWVSADSRKDNDGRNYYMARIELDANSLKQEGITSVIPGMEAQAQLVLGSKSVARYLLDPVFYSLSNAFREK